MLFQQTISILPFKQWLIKDKENKRLFFIAFAAMLILFGWLKIVYPYPNFAPPDSNYYVEAAAKNQFINLWPIGYSKFLRLISAFSTSHLALVLLQYLMLGTAVLYFLFTMKYLLSPGIWLFRAVLAISIFNPLLPHIANFVSSDCLFATLSLIWFTQLFWIIYQPTRSLLVIHAIILLLAFTVRFHAFYYPFISIIVIIITHMPKIFKWLSIGFMSLLISLFIGRTQYEYKLKTGRSQYSTFGGWQMAANALYGYAYAEPIDAARVPNKFLELHRIVNQHMDSLRHLKKRPDQEIGIYYLWNLKSPLRLYMNDRWKKKGEKSDYLTMWASVAPLYQKYGQYLIQKYPWSFLKHYAWPNLIRYYSPPLFFMGAYNMGNENVDTVISHWFKWKSNQLPLRAKDRHIYIMNPFPILLSIINPLFMLLSVMFIVFGGLSKCSKPNKTIIECMLLVWFGNTFFSIFAAPIELRYQIFQIVITLPFLSMFIFWMAQSIQPISLNPKQTITISEPL